MDRLIECRQDEERLIAFLKAQPKPYTIEYHEGRVRSPEQNRLQWVWANTIAKVDGVPARDIQNDWKLRWGVPILIAESKAFARMWLKIESHCSYEEQHEFVRDLPVTRIMTAKQCTRYLDQIHQWYTERGFDLAEPEREAA